MAMAEHYIGTQPQRYSLREYYWVVLFVHDVNREKPFSILNLNGLKTVGFPQHFIIGPLTENGRLQRFPVVERNGQLCSIFCKIEKGNFKILS